MKIYHDKYKKIIKYIIPYFNFYANPLDDASSSFILLLLLLFLLSFSLSLLFSIFSFFYLSPFVSLLLSFITLLNKASETDKT